MPYNFCSKNESLLRMLGWGWGKQRLVQSLGGAMQSLLLSVPF